MDLLLHDAEEAARDRAEGERLAYVAATRARDVLVVPVVGDEVYEGGWLDPLMPAVYPPVEMRRAPAAAPGVPVFRSKDSVLRRPDGDPARASTVAPGAYAFADPSGGAPSGMAGTGRQAYHVVWWDPAVLSLDAPPPLGLRRDDLIAKDGDRQAADARLGRYHRWRTERDAAIAKAAVRSVTARTASQIAADPRHALVTPEDVERVEIVDVSRAAGRPFGPQFGTLVHATLATVPLDASDAVVQRVAETQGRVLMGFGPGLDEEVYAAAEVVRAVLRHQLFDRVRSAETAGRCDRELPLLWQSPDGTLVEGTVDLAFDDGSGLTVVDFKTDRELAADLERYRRQVAIYARALSTLRGITTRGVLMRV
jgi:ATP-dependent exoDNAse (exonuclease V) beta subunit